LEVPKIETIKQVEIKQKPVEQIKPVEHPKPKPVEIKPVEQPKPKVFEQIKPVEQPKLKVVEQPQAKPVEDTKLNEPSKKVDSPIFPKPILKKVEFSMQNLVDDSKGKKTIMVLTPTFHLQQK